MKYSQATSTPAVIQLGHCGLQKFIDAAAFSENNSVRLTMDPQER